MVQSLGIFQVADVLAQKSVMLPPGGTLIDEAAEIKWSFRSDGKIIIEKKEEIKNRLGYSPDEFDALANTFYPTDYGFHVSDEELAAMEEDLDY